MCHRWSAQLGRCPGRHLSPGLPVGERWLLLAGMAEDRAPTARDGYPEAMRERSSCVHGQDSMR
eukprot:11710099-Alexandrium_andersonii.AAC.1